MKSTQIKHSLLLLLTATIWGVAFVAQSVGMDYVGPFTFNAVRSIIGGVVLIPVVFLLQKKNASTDSVSAAENTSKASSCSHDSKKGSRKLLIIGGIFCGIFLCFASNFQQFGIAMTDSTGKAGFITALYIILVPLLGIFFHKKVGKLVWISIVLATGGLYLLCVSSTLTLSPGDILLFICALLFSGHILIIDYFSPKVNGVAMSCIQFLVCGLLSAIAMFIFEKPSIHAILSAWQPILYAGVLSCGVAYTLQIVGQKDMNPTVASLILSLESVVSVLAGLLILHQSLSKREALGCVLMFMAIIIAQLPEKRKQPV